MVDVVIGGGGGVSLTTSTDLTAVGPVFTGGTVSINNCGVDLGRAGGSAWVLSGAAIDMDFSNGRYFGGTLATLLTSSRAAPATTYAETSGGALVSFAANALRITDLGLLIEPARTNVVLRNRDLTQAAWTKSNVTAALDQTGADGVATSASSITATAANATVLQAITLASSARFQSVYMKRLVGTGNIDMTTDNGATWTTVSGSINPATYTAVSIPSQTLANPTVGFRIVANGDSVAVDFVQNENGTNRSSPIPTTTATVTRNADDIVGAGALLSLALGPAHTQLFKTYFTSLNLAGGTASQTISSISDGTNNNRLYLRRQQSTGFPHIVLTTATTLTINADVGSAQYSLLTPQKSALAVAAGDQKAAFTGTVDTNSYTSALPVGSTTLRIGNSQVASAEYLLGYIQRMTWWASRLPDATLGALTGPSLPSLPLAAGAKILAFGHSMIARSYMTQGGGTNPITLVRALRRGVMPWVKWMDQRYNLDVWGDQNAPAWHLPANLDMLNGAFQGQNGDALEYQSALTPGTLYKTPYVIARGANIIDFDIGQNDYAFLLRDVPTVRAEYQKELDQFLAVGQYVVASSIYPIFGFGPGTAVDNNRLAHNAWLKSLDGVRTGFKFVDCDATLGTAVNPVYQDSASSGHLTDLGAYQLAKDRWLPVLQSMVSAGVYYNTDWTVSNIFPAATRGLLGTAGTSNGTVATGGIATGYFASRGAGQASTVVATKEVIDGSREKQVFTITPGADGTAIHTGNFRLQASPSLASLGLAVGDWVQFMWQLELSAWAYWDDYLTICGADNSGSATIQSWTTSKGTAPDTSDALVIMAICEPIQIPINSNNISFGTPMLNYSWQSAGTGTGVLKANPPIFRKATDPRSAFNLP